MINIGDRFIITQSSARKGSRKVGGIGYVIRAFFIPTIRCLLIEAVMVREKPEHKYLLLDLGMAKNLKYRLLSKDNIFQTVRLLDARKKLLDTMCIVALNRLNQSLIDIVLPFSSITDRYESIATTHRIDIPIVNIKMAPMDFRQNKYEFVAWMKANIFALNDILISYNNIKFREFLNDLYRFTFLEYRDIIEIHEDMFGKIGLIFHIRKITNDFHFDLCSQLQKLKARLYVFIKKFVSSSLIVISGLPTYRPHYKYKNITNILYNLDRLYYRDLDYSKHQHFLIKHYLKYHPAIKAIITGLYNHTLLSYEDRLRLILHSCRYKMIPNNEPLPNLIARLNKISPGGRFDKAALARFYELR